MKINWKLSPESREKVKKILRLRKEKLTFDQIAQLLHHHRTYIFALKKAGLDQGVENEDNLYGSVDPENKGIPTVMTSGEEQK